MSTQQQEYPTEESRREGNAAEEPQEEESNVCSSEARDRKELEECSGVDLRAIPSEKSGYVVMLFYLVFSFISFAFMLTSSCPIPWLNDGHGRKWTIWKDVDGTRWNKNPCDHKRAMFQATEAFAIAGCVISLLCVVVGVLQILGAGHLGVTLLFAIVDCAVLLVDWALIVNQYHKYSCPGEEVYVSHINRLNAGFCLTFISFALMLFAVISLGYWMNDTFKLSETHKAKYNGNAVKCMLLFGAILTIATVGTEQTMWERYFADYTMKITYWHVEFYDRRSSLSEFWGLNSYHCSKFVSMMHAGAAFSIISDAFLFLTLLFSVGAVYNRLFKWLTIGFGAASWVFLLICWAISVATRYKKFCTGGAVPTLGGVPLDTTEQVVDFTAYVITDGLGLIISAWCALTCLLIYFGVRA